MPPTFFCRSLDRLDRLDLSLLHPRDMCGNTHRPEAGIEDPYRSSGRPVRLVERLPISPNGCASFDQQGAAGLDFRHSRKLIVGGNGGFYTNAPSGKRHGTNPVARDKKTSLHTTMICRDISTLIYDSKMSVF